MSYSVKRNSLSQFSRLLFLPPPAHRRRITQHKVTLNLFGDGDASINPRHHLHPGHLRIRALLQFINA
jgi:hypothetical protein